MAADTTGTTGTAGTTAAAAAASAPSYHPRVQLFPRYHGRPASVRRRQRRSRPGRHSTPGGAGRARRILSGARVQHGGAHDGRPAGGAPSAPRPSPRDAPRPAALVYPSVDNNRPDGGAAVSSTVAVRLVLVLLVLVQRTPGQHRRKSNGGAAAAAAERRGPRNRLDVRQRHAQVPHAVSEKLLGFGVLSGLGLLEKLRQPQQET